MTNFFGKIRVERRRNRLVTKVVTILDNGEETVDFCTLDEILKAFRDTRLDDLPEAATAARTDDEGRGGAR